MPEKRITIRLTQADQSTNPYFYVPVKVPAGTTRIDVAIDYANAEDCIVDVGILDPRATGFPSTNGFRGWSGGARDRFFVATDDATPGYIAGAIPAGEWKVILGLYRIPSAATEVGLTVVLDSADRPVVGLPEVPTPVRAGRGWYKGDLHCHTFHSDARGAPETLHAAARAAGIDFLAVTDHNTISQHRYFQPHSSVDLVFVRGMEITTAAGHANVFGLDAWIDFRMTRPSDAHVLAELVHRRGGLLSINHDKPPIPWQYDLPAIDCMEVWHSHWLNHNWASLARYEERLRAGRRISLIGGSDFHQPEELVPEGPLALARPTTVLWLEELSGAAILSAMKAGRGYVTEAPNGPHLSFTANGQPMGADLEPSSPTEVIVEVKGAAGDRLVWHDASGVVADTAIPGAVWNARYMFDSFRGFLRAEVVAIASRNRLIDDFRMASDAARALPDSAWRDIAQQPIRRALSNPVYGAEVAVG